MIPLTITSDIVYGICYGHQNPIPFQGFIQPTPLSEKINGVSVNLANITQGYTTCGHTFIFTSSNFRKSIFKANPVMLGDQTQGIPLGTITFSNNITNFVNGI